MENGRTFETVVGIIVLVVAGLFFHYVYKKSNWNNINGYALCAKFDRVDGLSEGCDVRVSGVKVGKIMDISVDTENFLAMVKFQIPNEIKLPKDSSANISNDGLLGGKYLSLTPGGEEDCLVDGDEIENTTGAISIESLIGKFLMPGKSDEQKTDNDIDGGTGTETSSDGEFVEKSNLEAASTEKGQNTPHEFSVEFIGPGGKSEEKVIIEENNGGENAREVRFVVGPELTQAIQDEIAAEGATATEKIVAGNEKAADSDERYESKLTEKTEAKITSPKISSSSEFTIENKSTPASNDKVEGHFNSLSKVVENTDVAH